MYNIIEEIDQYFIHFNNLNNKLAFKGDWSLQSYVYMSDI